MFKLLLLALGGAMGTIARYGLNGLVSHHQSKHLPWAAVFPLGTVLVNVSGCFLIGFIAAMSGPALGRGWMKPEWRDFWLIGFCGGYTTFSSYGLQTLNLARDAEWLWVALNIIGSNVLCLAAVWLGRTCGLWLQKT
ncbi:MAG: fluoride efflux transporter CrcB [Verrucomicrobiia bacterium]